MVLKKSATVPATKKKRTSNYDDGAFEQDPMNLYLEDISHISLLSREEEVSLARQIEKGIEAEAQLLSVNITSAERQMYHKLISEGVTARNRLIEANYRLVISVAKKYANQGVSFMDLIQEGNIGLIKAVKKFDYQRGYKFSTYATWWIRQAVTRALADQGRTIRIPVHMSERINRYSRTIRGLLQTLGREPTKKEIADAMEMTEKGISQLEKIIQHPLSIEKTIGEGQESNLGDFLEDNSSPTLTEAATQQFLKERMDRVLTSLSAREGRILRLRFGLYDGKTYTLEEVGQKFGVTRERVRQIESTALRKLRHPRRSRPLRDFLG